MVDGGHRCESSGGAVDQERRSAPSIVVSFHPQHAVFSRRGTLFLAFSCVAEVSFGVFLSSDVQAGTGRQAPGSKSIFPATNAEGSFVVSIVLFFISSS